MRPTFPIAAALLLLACAADAARAQARDAMVLPRGAVELSAGATYTRFDRRFGDGGTVGLAPDAFSAAIPGTLFARVTEVEAALDSIFSVAGRAGGPAYDFGAADLALGTLDVDLAADLRDAPFALSAGLTDRLTVGVVLPIERRRTAVTGLRLAGALLGANTAGDSLSVLLGAIDEELAGLGSTAYLPVAGSPAGLALQQAYAAATGDTTTLPLPGAGLSPSQLNTLLSAEALRPLPYVSEETEYRLGDVEVTARYQVVNTLGGPLAPPVGGRGLRATVEVGAILPTGSGGDLDSLTWIATPSGHPGATGALFADWFAGRFRVDAHARYTLRMAADVTRRSFDPARPFDALGPALSLSRDPGDRVELSVTPQFRLTDEISFAARYGFARAGEGSLDVPALEEGRMLAGIESLEGWTTHRVGLGGSYSTWASYREGRADVPFEVSLTYENAVAGGGLAPDLGRVVLSARLFVQAWGRAPRPVSPAEQEPPPVAEPTPSPAPPSPTP